MADDGITPPHYEFSDKYDPNHARKYFHKHNTGFWRRLSTWREVGMARKALELAGQPRSVLARIEKSFCCSAFDTGLPDNFVECVFSIRLLHHIEKSADRVLMLQEFARISSGTVIVSLWVDGNFRAWRHEINEARKERTRGKERPRDRFVFKRSEIERDFAAAGLEMIGHADFIRYWDKWRAYVLRVKK
jgi:hypothetical protein